VNIFSELERLITEHGSSPILKERIAFLRDQFDVLNSQKQVAEEQVHLLKAKIVSLEKEIQSLNEDNKNLEINNANLESQHEGLHRANPENHVCDHCGSSKIKLTGSRMNDKYGWMGVKDSVFTCEECKKESSFFNIPK
jgi:chromosome segregation ATPase